MSDYILPEVVTEILKRLPVKSLLRFRCVCREWCSLISSPNFVSQHLSHTSSSPTPHTLVRHYSKLHSKEIYTLFDDNTFAFENSTRINFPGKSRFYSRIVGCCNGVLCLFDDLFGYKETIILWNPSIRRAINVPTPRVTYDQYGPHRFALGFAHDSASNDYKIVRLAYLMDDGYKFPPKVEVFSVSLGTWRLVKSNITYCTAEWFWSQAVRNGVVHWLGFSGSIPEKGHNLILSFDMSTEAFGELCLPESLISLPFVNMRVTMLNESVSVFCYDRPLGCSECAIWVMKDYGNSESWINQYNVNLAEETVVAVLRNDRMALAKRNRELFLYNYKNNTITKTGVCGTRLSVFVDKYVESLVLMGKGREVRGRNHEPDYEDEDDIVEIEEIKYLEAALMSIFTSLSKSSMT